MRHGKSLKIKGQPYWLNVWLKVDHSTINRWVIDYSPQLEEVFRKRHKRPVGISWRMDETYILIRLGGKRENKIAKELLEHFIWNQ